MTANGYLQLAFYLVVLIALAKPLGTYMAAIYEGKPAIVNQLGAPLERLIYRVCGVKESEEMSWTRYALASLWFTLFGLLAVYGLQRLQALLPLNPAGMGAVSPDSSFNTAVSFVTNTNWQGYGGESTMSYLTQMLALTVQNFVSAALGMAVLIALIRGFARQSSQTLGNFWVDLTRGTPSSCCRCASSSRSSSSARACRRRFPPTRPCRSWSRWNTTTRNSTRRANR